MKCWRITKYNPKFRNELGHYQKKEWTSVSDIGKIFEGKQLTVEEYLNTENLYINSIDYFITALKLSGLKVEELEKNKAEIALKQPDNLYLYKMTMLFNSVKNNQFLNIQEVRYISRLILREQLWCKLTYGSTFFVHFGYDYYMYIGCHREYKEIFNKIVKSGLFVEQFESPYI
jgi:hypothetical protein